MYTFCDWIMRHLAVVVCLVGKDAKRALPSKATKSVNRSSEPARFCLSLNIIYIQNLRSKSVCRLGSDANHVLASKKTTNLKQAI